MNHKSFTLIEILIGLIILSLLASFSVATYQKTIAANKNHVCQQNLKVLAAAVDIYVLENDSLPVTLSQLKPEHIHLAHEKILGKTSENKFLAFLSNIFSLKPAIAQVRIGTDPLGGKYYGNERKVFLCPADPDYKTKLQNINAPLGYNCNTSTTSPYVNCPFTGTNSSYNFLLNDQTVDETTGKLIKTSQFAIFFDGGNWHPKPGFGLQPNGITPSGCTGGSTGFLIKSNMKVNGCS